MELFELCTLKGKVLGSLSDEGLAILYPRAREHIYKLKAQPGETVIVGHGDLLLMIRHQNSSAIFSIPKAEIKEKKEWTVSRSNSNASQSNSKAPSAANTKRRRARIVSTIRRAGR